MDRSKSDFIYTFVVWTIIMAILLYSSFHDPIIKSAPDDLTLQMLETVAGYQ